MTWLRWTLTIIAPVPFGRPAAQPQCWTRCRDRAISGKAVWSTAMDIGGWRRLTAVPISLREGDSPEVAQFAIDPVALDHVVDAQAGFLVEGHVVDAEGLRLAEIETAGVTS